MKNPTLFRRRFIPDECIELKDDIIINQTDTCIVTKWKTIRSRSDLSSGYSCYYLDRGYKVSKFLKSDGSLLCWYCDIVTYEPDEEKNSLLVIDLLADVKIFPDGRIKVLDLDELSEAFEKHLINESLLKKSLLSLNRLLNEIYADGIEPLAAPIEDLVRQ
jgi:predicted RNA-binding protein associated with RNAse of E/G family